MTRIVSSPRPRSPEDVEQLRADARVQPDGRLVEEEDARARDEGPCDFHPSPLAAAVGADGPVDEVAQPDRVYELLDSPLRRRGLDAPQATVQVEVAAAGQGAIDHGVLEDDAAHLARGELLRPHVEAGEPSRAARRPDGRGQHPDRRRFACSVRAQEGEHLARGDLEVDASDRLDAAGVDLAELLHFDHLCLLVTSIRRVSSPS